MVSPLIKCISLTMEARLSSVSKHLTKSLLMLREKLLFRESRDTHTMVIYFSKYPSSNEEHGLLSHNQFAHVQCNKLNGR